MTRTNDYFQQHKYIYYLYLSNSNFTLTDMKLANDSPERKDVTNNLRGN